MGFFADAYARLRASWTAPAKQPRKPDAVQPRDFYVPPASVDYPDGIIEADLSTGRVRLFAAEGAHTQCLGSDSKGLRQLASELPEWWFWRPALDNPRFAWSPAARFNIDTNTSAAAQRALQAGPYTIATDNKPDPSGKSGWIEGSTFPKTAAFPARLTLNDLPGVFKAVMNRSLLSL